MNLVRLTPDYELTDFDCGDEQLNNFLFEDAKPSLELRVANTFILEDDGRIAAYFCILNDKVSKDEVIGSRWKKIRSNFPQSKQFRSYPTIKIGRFAVSKDYRGQQVGRRLMNIVKDLLHHSASNSAFRFITVDAYFSAVPFYEKNGFPFNTGVSLMGLAMINTYLCEISMQSYKKVCKLRAMGALKVTEGGRFFTFRLTGSVPMIFLTQVPVPTAFLALYG